MSAWARVNMKNTEKIADQMTGALWMMSKSSASISMYSK